MMPLPDDDLLQWPPEAWDDVYHKYAEHSAWYSGDPEKIASVYAQIVFTPTPQGRFWARDLYEEKRVSLHVPIAGDIAETSADMLFSEVPAVRIPEAHVENAPADAKKAQDRLWALIDDGGIHNRLLEAAESASALGGVFVGPVWDRDVTDMPLLRVVQADAALPEFRWGILTAVTLWRVVEDDNGVVWRHLERHEPGVILHGLYRGGADRLGRRVPLTAHSDTQDLEDVVRLPNVMSHTLAIRYVPNVRPNRRFRGDTVGGYLGRSDYAGSEPLMDALDEAYSSWQRDIRLAKARGVVPEEWLERPDGSSSLKFDEDREFFVAMAGAPGEQVSRPEMFQPAIRFQEHSSTCMHYLERIISAAGYSPQSFGLEIEGRAESGTALRIRERKSLVTSQRKQRFWKPVIDDVLWMMLVIDREVFRSGVTVYRPSTIIGDSVAESTRELAESVELISRARAASTQTLVAMLHPDWDDNEVKAEVERIRQEQGQFVEDPLQIGLG